MADERCRCTRPHWPPKLIRLLRDDPTIRTLDAARRVGLDPNRRRADHLVARRLDKHAGKCDPFARELRELDPDFADDLETGAATLKPADDVLQIAPPYALEHSRYRHLFRE